MFVVLLRFGPHRQQAVAQLPGHEAWLRDGFAAGHFLASGSLATGDGGAVVCAAMPRESLDELVAADPFVSAGVVVPEIIEIAVSLTDDRLGFLAA